jgi:hypothetical protein
MELKKTLKEKVYGSKDAQNGKLTLTVNLLLAFQDYLIIIQWL